MKETAREFAEMNKTKYRFIDGKDSAQYKFDPEDFEILYKKIQKETIEKCAKEASKIFFMEFSTERAKKYTKMIKDIDLE